MNFMATGPRDRIYSRCGSSFKMAPCHNSLCCGAGGVKKVPALGEYSRVGSWQLSTLDLGPMRTERLSIRMTAGVCGADGDDQRSPAYFFSIRRIHSGSDLILLWETVWQRQDALLILSMEISWVSVLHGDFAVLFSALPRSL